MQTFRETRMLRNMVLEDYLALRYPYELVEDEVHGGYFVHHDGDDE
jgi:hypothetical protein